MTCPQEGIALYPLYRGYSHANRGVARHSAAATADLPKHPRQKTPEKRPFDACFEGVFSESL